MSNQDNLLGRFVAIFEDCSCGRFGEGFVKSSVFSETRTRYNLTLLRTYLVSENTNRRRNIGRFIYISVDLYSIPKGFLILPTLNYEFSGVIRARVNENVGILTLLEIAPKLPKDKCFSLSTAHLHCPPTKKNIRDKRECPCCYCH